LTEKAGKQRRDDEDDEYDGPRDELRYAAVQLGLSAAVLGADTAADIPGEQGSH